MTSLSDLTVRLQNQFLDPASLAVPPASYTEAFRSALGRLNAFLATSYILSGLDTDLNTTLPDALLPALLLGAAAAVVGCALRGALLSYDNSQVNPDRLQAESDRLRKEFQSELVRLRLVQLQQSADAPFFNLPDPSNLYDPSLDA